MESLNSAMVVFGVVTAAGTAILTVTTVWKLLMGPLNNAIQSIKESVLRLEGRIEMAETKTANDVKEIWKYLAERGGA